MGGSSLPACKRLQKQHKRCVHASATHPASTQRRPFGTPVPTWHGVVTAGAETCLPLGVSTARAASPAAVSGCCRGRRCSQLAAPAPPLSVTCQLLAAAAHAGGKAVELVEAAALQEPGQGQGEGQSTAEGIRARRGGGGGKGWEGKDWEGAAGVERHMDLWHQQPAVLQV